MHKDLHLRRTMLSCSLWNTNLSSISACLFHHCKLSSPTNKCYVIAFTNDLHNRKACYLRLIVLEQIMTGNHLPLPEIEAMCNHAQEPLLLPTGKATENQQDNNVTFEKRTTSSYKSLINRMHLCNLQCCNISKFLLKPLH